MRLNVFREYSLIEVLSYRVCPGRHLAMDSLFALTASMLATLRFEALKDSNGQPIPVPEEYTSGFVS